MSELLPLGAETAWAMKRHDLPRNRPRLSTGLIVSTAVALADAEGLTAVAMKRVAAELEATPMALYRHVSCKHELLTLMGDAIFDPPPADCGPGEHGAGEAASAEPWRTALTQWATAHLSVLRAHPWVLEIPTSGPPAMPNQLAWLDRALAAFEGTPLSGPQRLSSVMLVSGFVRTTAAQEAAVLEAARAADREVDQYLADYWLLLTELTARAPLPALRAVVSAAPVGRPHDEFTFGLDRILDGIADLVRRGEAR